MVRLVGVDPRPMPSRYRGFSSDGRLEPMRGSRNVVMRPENVLDKHFSGAG